MTLAAIDRLVHHATIFEMNVESYRRKTAISRLTENSDGATPTLASALAD
ncbi:hypothetical protein SM11_chr0230 [Sinorhizobium meliloti SM11]|nr:hypothetical protein SM11_chr0230 [Sinorhizobium meliloti SM11]